MSRQFSNKVVLESLGTKPQVENDHAGGERADQNQMMSNLPQRALKKIIKDSC